MSPLGRSKDVKERLQAHLAVTMGTQDTKAQNQKGNNVRVSVHFLALGSPSSGELPSPFSCRSTSAAIKGMVC